MKNKVLGFVILLFFMAHPVYAGASYTISLNGFVYTPKHAVFTADKMLYISLYDLETLTYGKSKVEDGKYTLAIQNSTIKFIPNDRIISVNNKTTIIPNKPLAAKSIIYLPINLLDVIQYPYTLNKEQHSLSITAVAPHNRTTNSYEDHQLAVSGIKDLSIFLKSLIPEDKALKLLEDAKKSNSYISFIDNTDKDSLLKLMDLNLSASQKTPIQVVFRELDLLSVPEKSSGLKTLPLKVSVNDNLLSAQIGEDKIKYNCIWAAYMPDESTPKIDVSESLDATIMRMIYEYFRDKYDLKDDVYFSPAVIIKTGHVHAVSYTAYADHIMGQKNVYTIIVYKTYDEAARPYYIVDFLLAH